AEAAVTASSKEDGILRSSEIFGLDLGSDMVVLSARNTGLGKVVKGEGMLGIQRSFFYAGTETVVVSLWSVYDRSTASLMKEFYKALIHDTAEESWIDTMLRWTGWDESIPFGKRAAAMRQAKLKMIEHPLFNHPVYWAPFIVVGRYRIYCSLVILINSWLSLEGAVSVLAIITADAFFVRTIPANFSNRILGT